jgi:metal-dependent amidase/aminoacylase/carboxypeptidase family protein
LDKLKVPYKKAGSTSLIATLKGSKKGKIVALRGDIDALSSSSKAVTELFAVRV